MSAFIWTMVVLYVIGIIGGVYHFAAGKVPTPLGPAGRAVALLLQIAMLVWAISVLGVA